MRQLVLGLDIGSSSVKAALVDTDTGQTVVAAQSPAEEMPMLALQPGWAEQDPELWWTHAVASIRRCLASISATDRIAAVGIAYQMHGLVIVDRDKKALRPAIIWCDSRAVEIGDAAYRALGNEQCLAQHLNSPANFTAAKLAWVKKHERDIYNRVFKFMLPGDYIAMRLCGDITTTATGLSEGIFWDYSKKHVSSTLLDHFGFPDNIVPDVKPVFSVQGELTREAAHELGLKPGIVISYRAGDQPNNAFSLGVLEPGETAATAGTSGVIYAVTDKNAADPASRVNTFIHVNNTTEQTRNGVLLCINGTGILNSWLRRNSGAAGKSFSYAEMNSLAQEAPIGSEGLRVLPFGNGAERILGNRNSGASFHGLDFNRHQQAHMFRASQEGIVFSLRYGFDILRQMGLQTKVIRAADANMFLSPLFREAFVNTIDAPLQLFNTSGATGAAIGAGIGAGLFTFADAFKGLSVVAEQHPESDKCNQYQAAYHHWKSLLNIAI